MHRNGKDRTGIIFAKRDGAMKKISLTKKYEAIQFSSMQTQLFNTPILKPNI